MLEPNVPARSMNSPDKATDAHLLAAYQASRTGELFAQIHTRHGAMVYRTARRLTANRQDAEDVVQAVFALLAQRPELVQHNLGGWLHEVTRNTALKQQRCRARRARRERTAARLKSNKAVPGDKDLREELDAALARLEPALREAVVLRYFEGHSQEESARLAGCPRGTLSWRAAEGLKHLRVILARRGVVVTPALLVTFLGQEAAKKVPAALAASISSMAAASAKVTAKTVFWIKVIACATAVTAAATVTTLTVTSLRRQPPPPAPPPAPVVRGPVVAPFAPAGALDMGLPRKQRGSPMSLMPKEAGSHVWEDGTLTIKSSGLDVFNTHDSCYFVYQTLTGDGAISARIVKVEKAGPFPKAGVMLRESLEPDAANVFLDYDLGGKTIDFQIRPTTGAKTSHRGVKGMVPYWVKLVRRGNTVTASISPDGESYKEVGQKDLDLPEKVYIGLAATSHNDGVVNTSVFDQATVTTER